MVNVTPSSGRSVVRRRQINEDDLPALARLLSRGFRLRPKSYWMRGLLRQRQRSVPEGRPRYGYLLESDDRLVGALLTIYSELEVGGKAIVRCNHSSWFVEPNYRANASLLLSVALKDKELTYVNVSAAPNTWAIVEAQGFRCYGRGKFLSFPALGGSAEKTRISTFEAGASSERSTLRDSERTLLKDHAAWGCTCLVVEADDGSHPFVFSRTRILRRLIPTMQLVYCRDSAEFVRFAGALGRYLMKRGMPTVLIEAEAERAGLVGCNVHPERRLYARGPYTPKLGDLAYTEGVFYGA